MGGTSSKSTADVLNDIAISATQRTTQDCVTSSVQIQEVSIDKVDGDFNVDGSSMEQGATLNMDCVFTAKKQNEIQTAIANDIVQKIAAESKGMLQSFGGTETEATVNIKNMLNVSVTQEDIQKSTTSTMQSQKIAVKKVKGSVNLKDLSFKQTSELVAKTMMNTSAYSSAINSIANKMDQEAKSKGTGLDGVLGDLLGGIVKDVMGGLSTVALGGFVVIIIIAIVVAAVLFMIGPQNIMKMLSGDFSSKKSRDDESNDKRDRDDESDDEDSDAKSEDSQRERPEKSGSYMKWGQGEITSECRACDCITDSVTGKCRPGCTCPCHSKTGGCGCFGGRERDSMITGGCCL